MTDSFAKRLIEVARNADMPSRRNITMDLINTKLLEPDSSWWAVRAYIISTDKDKQAFDISMGERLSFRNN
jgi:hypothetical protein